MELKTFKLDVVIFYGIPTVLFLFPALLVIMTLTSPIFTDENLHNVIRVIVFFGSFIGGIYLVGYSLTAKCLITVNDEGLSLDITKWGIGIRRKQMFYTWSEVDNFRDYQVRNGRNIVFNFKDNTNITLYDKNRALFLYLKKYFPTKDC